MSVRGMLGSSGRRLSRYGVVRLGRRVGLSAPVIGLVLILPVLRAAIKHKGVVRGTIDTALDATPVIGTAKAAVELFTGELIAPRRPGAPARRTPSTPRLSFWRSSRL